MDQDLGAERSEVSHSLSLALSLSTINPSILQLKPSLCLL